MALNAAPLPKEAEVSRTLEKLKNQPITTDGSQDAILGPIYSLLISAPPGENKVLHWFCDKAKPVVVQAATFLLRLHAYNNPRVVLWKDKMANVLQGCCGCVQSYADIKITCRDTYFAAFSKPVLDAFFSTVDAWEAVVILNAIKNAGVFPGSKKSLSEIPPSVLYHIMVAIPLFGNAEFRQILEECPPSFIASGWPVKIPPGLLLLLFNEKNEIRAWGQQQLIGSSPIDEARFVGDYELVFQSVAIIVASGAPKSSSGSQTNETYSFTGPLRDYFTMSPSALWAGMQDFIRLLPPTIMKSENHTARIFRHAVIGHLYDTSSHFPGVLRAFVYLLKMYEKLLWQGEDYEYPQVVFDSIKDNTAYIHLVQETEVTLSQLPWFLEWFQTYLHSLSNLPIFGDVLRKVVGFTCEELQHERFKDKRPVIMTSILQTLHNLFQSSNANDKNAMHSTIAQVVDIHADVVIGVALSSRRNTTAWQTARTAARRLLESALEADSRCAETVVYQVSDVLQQANSPSEPKRKYDLRAPSFHKKIWKTMYETVTGEDSEGIVLLISLVARSAHLDKLNPDAFNPAKLPSGTRMTIAGIITAVNEGFYAMREGFSAAITHYTNTTTSTAEVIKTLLRRPDMSKYIMALLLSPIEELQMAIQILLNQAFDVDVRSECFRSMLRELPVHSLDGLITAVAAFNECSPLFPEACNFAKSLVRCMTDVIEVLTNGHDGLLFDERFGGGSDSIPPHSRLPKLWRVMCQAITSIFRRTPHWSKVIEPDAMIDWMRDALIFARDLVAQRRTFETASVVALQQSKTMTVTPRKLSQVGRQMLEDLQPVLTESTRWLRLTDMELLHQSSNLVRTLMDTFREAEFKPSQDALTKLEKFLDSSRRKSTPEDQRTKLSDAHLSELTAALSFFTDDDDEIQLVESKPLAISEAATSSRDKERASLPSRDVRGHQTKLDKFVSKTSGKTTPSTLVSRSPAPFSSKLKPFVEIPKRNKASQPSSLMAQVRQQAATMTKGAPTLAGRVLPKKPEVSIQTIRKEPPPRPAIKDESFSKKSYASENTSSSEEEEEESQGGLASLGKLQKSPVIKKAPERKTIKMIEPVFTAQNAALERIRKREEAQRAALRMKPDLRPLYRTILSWNYEHGGSEPPLAGKKPQYTPIQDRFESDQEYQRIFEPLLTLECWNQLIKSKEEALPEVVTCRIDSRQYVDEWLDLDISVISRPPDRWRLSETDIVHLRQLEGKNNILAKVQSSRRMPTEIQATLRCMPNVSGIDLGLHIHTQWRLTKVFSLSTISREFAALKALPYYDFYPEIMRPRPASISQLSPLQVQTAMKSYQVNEPQAIAILGSLQTDGFTLIQGPPGTGKTWTICGIVGAFLSSRARPATVVQAGRGGAPFEKTPPRKILVCAPSNAAIDEVAKRLKNGVRGSDGNVAVPNIVRVGAEEAVNTSVKDISLDQLVDRKLEGNSSSTKDGRDSATTLASLRSEMDALKNARALKLQEMDATRDNVSRLQVLDLELKSLNSRRMTLSQQFNRLKDLQKSASRTLDASRRKYRAEVLMGADVICSTLSGAGHEVLESLDFEMIVIDEAAQSIELSSLIPLKYRAKRCIMVGDPQQLPPTVLSPLANQFGYGQSLFVRLQKSRPEAVHLLSIQYRMHPDISHLPSQLFYDRRLLDGPGMAEKTAQIWHNNPLFGPYKFVNVASGREQAAHSGHSLVNRTECDIAVTLYSRIKTEYSKVDFDFRIGVITMYRAQLLELKKKFQVTFGKDIVEKVDFNTVDGFQGQEKDIIILSCVRAGPGVQSIGFLADQRRLNVAITRARSSLFILGHAATLGRSDPVWKQIVEDARSTSRLLDADLSTYRKPLKGLSTTLATSNSPPLITPRPITTPRNLDTQTPQIPKGLTPTKSISTTFPTMASSKQTSALSSIADESTSQKPEASSSNSPATTSIKRRRNSEDNDIPRPAPALRNKTDTEVTKPKPMPPRPPPTKKRPKEVTMFIPKKKPEMKRPVSPDPRNPAQGDAKRRLSDNYFQ